MPTAFPTEPWIKALQAQLNSSPAYAEIARNWEGDLCFQIDWPDGAPPTFLYVDLWHGQCREAYLVPADLTDKLKPAFRLMAPIGNFVKVLKGELDPMQAMVTGKLKVQGNMLMMMKNIPTVLEFVRNCREIDTEFPMA